MNSAPGVQRHIAMWSGPRNISTALLRAWGNRPDTLVCDEPLYAHYLIRTRRPHPGAEEIIRHQENDWRKVVDVLTGPIPDGKTVFYQKHMAHHLLPHIERNWLGRLRHAFLIRHPRQMLISLDRVFPDPRLEDTGLPQQVEIFERVRSETGRVPPVVNARDLLKRPRAVLAALCEALEVPFDEAMLAWSPGRRSTDGVWASHWYASVEASTGFEPYQPRNDPLPSRLEPLLETCMPYYEELYAHRIVP